MTMNTKTLTNTLMVALLSLAFSTATLLSAMGPAVNVVPNSAVAQSYVA